MSEPSSPRLDTRKKLRERKPTPYPSSEELVSGVLVRLTSATPNDPIAPSMQRSHGKTSSAQIPEGNDVAGRENPRLAEGVGERPFQPEGCPNSVLSFEEADPDPGASTHESRMPPRSKSRGETRRSLSPAPKSVKSSSGGGAAKKPFFSAKRITRRAARGGTLGSLEECSKAQKEKRPSLRAPCSPDSRNMTGRAGDKIVFSVEAVPIQEDLSLERSSAKISRVDLDSDETSKKLPQLEETSSTLR